jgi:hypothetical protein
MASNLIFALDIHTERFLADRSVRVGFVFLSSEEDGTTHYRRGGDESPLHWIVNGRLLAEAIPLSSQRGDRYDGPADRYSWDQPTIHLERETAYGAKKTAAAAERLINKLEKIRTTDGPAADFAGYIAYLARVTGAKHAWLASDFSRSVNRPGRMLVSIGQAVCSVREWMDDATALGRQATAAQAAE